MKRWRYGMTWTALLAACVGGSHAPGQRVKVPGQTARPQTPKPPFPYDTEEVRYANAKAEGVDLAGTFTKPRTESPTPAVLLISGAGQQERDNEVAGHKPFLVLADYLTRHGIAVLRVDDRGAGQSTGEFARATTKDFAADAEAGVGYLLTRKDVDQAHIGLIGQGEGAIVAAMVAAETPKVSFIVLLSGTAVPGELVLLAQTARAETAAGMPDEQIQADLKLGAGLYRMAAAGRSAADMKQALANAPEQFRPFIDPWERQVPRFESAWLRAFLVYDPSTALEQVKCPVLALFGEKDMTLDPDQNASAMKRAFSKSHNKETKIKVLPGLNDLFQKAKTGLPGEYASIAETMSPAALENIETWISERAK